MECTDVYLNYAANPTSYYLWKDHIWAPVHILYFPVEFIHM